MTQLPDPIRGYSIIIPPLQGTLLLPENSNGCYCKDICVYGLVIEIMFPFCLFSISVACMFVARYLARMNSDPESWMRRDYKGELRESLREVCEFLRLPFERSVFVENATTGPPSAYALLLRSLSFFLPLRTQRKYWPEYNCILVYVV